jgi:hypothetical protein
MTFSFKLNNEPELKQNMYYTNKSKNGQQLQWIEKKWKLS